MISLDTETTGLDFHHGAKPYLVTICDEDGNNSWWEWDVDPLTREPQIPEEDLDEIQTVIHAADQIVLQNPKFDVRALQTAFRGRLQWDWAKTRDTLIAGHLLASNAPHNLTTMVLVYLGYNSQPFEDAIKEATNKARRIARRDFPEWKIAKAGLAEMPSAKASCWKFDMWLPKALVDEASRDPAYAFPEHWLDLVSEYANSDSATTIALYKEQRKLLKKRGLWKIYEERLKILSVVYEMEQTGITLNRNRLEELETTYQEESAKAEKVCLSVARKYKYDLTLPKSGNNGSLTTFIFEEMKLDPVKVSQKTGKPSLDAECMDHYKANLPGDSQELRFITALGDKRKRDTALNYMEGYRRFGVALTVTYGRKVVAVSHEWFRLFPSLNPTGTDTLRMSSSNPNEQNISRKEGFNLRYCFGPAPHREWWSLDYDNLELRIPAYESDEREMIELFEKPDEAPFFGSYHLLVASILHPKKWEQCLREDVSFKKKYPTIYGQTKNFNFADQYGAVMRADGYGTADRAAGIQGAQAKVRKRLPEIAKLNVKMIAFAEKHGYVETMPDKEVDSKRGYPLLCSRSRWGGVKPTIPLNYHVQGTACWIMCRAMVKVQAYLDILNREHKGKNYQMIMNVHDEIVLDFPKRLRKGNLPKVQKIRKIMESIGDCVGVPLTCGIDYHPNNWSEGISV